MNAFPVRTSALLLSIVVASVPVWAAPPPGNEQNFLPQDMHYLNETIQLPAQQDPVSVAVEPVDDAVQKKWNHSYRKKDYSLDYSSVGKRKAHRMSDEQRRDLRRQINDASHDVYISGN